MRQRFVERQPLQLRLLSAGDHVDVIPAAQAVIEHVQQAVGIRRIVDANHFAAPLQRVVHKSRRLVAEAIVIVSPGVAGDEDIQRSDAACATEIRRHCSIHFACCVTIESTTCANAS